MARRRLLYHYFYLTYGGERYSEEVTVSPFSPDGGADGFSVMSSKAWEVLSSPSWLWISPVEGEKGMTQVQISAGTHAGSDVREDNITIRTIDGRYTAMIHVSQAADAPYITVNGQTGSTQISVPFRNTQTVLSVSSKGGWTAAVTGATLAPTAQTNFERVVTETVVTYGKNTSTSDTRTVTVVLTNTQDPTKSVAVTIVQAPQSYIDLEWAAGTPELLPWNGWDGTVVVETNISSYLNASEGVTITPSEVTAGTTNASAHMPGSSTAGPITYAIFGNTSDLDSDGIDSDSISIVMEAKPYLEVPDITIQSGETAGTVTYVSNYAINPNSFTGAGISEIVVEGDILTVKTSSTPLWNEDRTLTLQVETIGTVGPSMTQTVNVTQKGKVAELAASGHTTNKNAGSTFITFTTNDTITVDTTGFPSWLSFDRIDYAEGKVWFTVTQNTGTAARNHDITLTTTHNGADGQPVSQTVTLTQGANADTRTNVTVNARLKQNSSGRWYLITDTMPSAINDFRFTMSYGNAESITALTNESDLRVVTGGGGQTAVGTEITVRGFSPDTYDAGPNPGGGENYYDITYVSSATVYSTWVSGYDEVELKSLNYTNTVIPASGGSVTPTSYTVSYREVIANSFDDSTSLSELKEITINGKPGSISGITSNGGTIASSTSVVNAPSRGTVEGDVWNVAEITAVTFNFSGNTYTDRDITNVIITQQANVKNYVPASSWSTTADTPTSCTKTGSTVDSTGFTVSNGNRTFTAGGYSTTAPTQKYITLDVYVTGNSYDLKNCFYDAESYSAFTYTSNATSHKDSAWTVTRRNIRESTGRYNEEAIYTGSSQSWLSYNGTNNRVLAESRGTTASTSSRSAYLTFKTPIAGGTATRTVAFEQEANTVSPGTTNTVCGTTTFSYSNVKIDLKLRDNNTVLGEDVPGVFNADGTTQKGASRTTGIKAYAIETADETKTTPYTTTTTWEYASGAESSHTETGSIVSTDLVSIDRTSSITYTAATGFAFYGGSSSASPATVTAENRGTTTGDERSETLSVTASIDSSKSDSEVVKQVANTTASTEWFNSGETTEIQNRVCHLSCSPTAATFVNGSGGLSKTITAYSSADYDSVYTKRGDERTIYTSGASAKTRSNVVITSTTTSYRNVPVKPGGSWTINPPVANVTVSGPSQSTNTSAYTYVFTSSTPATAPTATTSDGKYKFTSPSGNCTAEVAFSYSGTTPTYYPTITQPQARNFLNDIVTVQFDFSPGGKVATVGKEWVGSFVFNVTGYNRTTGERPEKTNLVVYVSGKTVTNFTAPDGVSFDNIGFYFAQPDTDITVHKKDPTLPSSDPPEASFNFSWNKAGFTFERSYVSGVVQPYAK